MEMNVYKRLNEARQVFHEKKLTKSGHNKFAAVSYTHLTLPTNREV